ncbi:phosphatidylinositol- -trisphosphate 3-phosphatase, putative [Ichthyophthirius multifiliis]|uniref:Phosphatidylinositol--trisphosphate 3-phosphatase, putative n=1 Tax=Ichthyophthirius multifiliis TaxID=5932 RepID=G0QMV4_ICHMU|nr:phosphatidylinositol- -trisphosphate 3-phosphatase, putative [Ichthyophthirius multifiliis]EGR33452.1 phosphatidylinositol- -trisphosphate 3-phosphatase, putative [Ichthyophthirius multifiliis]|eukprot:XP_004037438.1 phosphatidylinositol- -trisphosphate 3-phosphatase, putative [Ichthyophthirius multifiliis]
MDYFREMVSGPKKRFQQDGYNLDLTYICERIIAMSFPASGIETLYRNDIQSVYFIKQKQKQLLKVVELIKKNHQSNFLIVNLSGRKYDYSKFDNKVVDYEWEDHHSPPIDTLFQISNTKNVVVIHCLAGKGRTGTIICCYLIYSGKFKTPEDALYYYSKKRFEKEGVGVNQPCQVRYVHYFYDILKQKNIYPTVKYITQIQLVQRPNFGSDSCSPFVEIYNVNTKEKLITTELGYFEQKVFNYSNEIFVLNVNQKKPVYGDVLVKLKNKGLKNQTMLRVSFNTAFIEKQNEINFKLSELSPSQLISDKRFPKDFIFKVLFFNKKIIYIKQDYNGKFL